MGTPVPSDTDAEGYILIATVSGSTVTQIVTGSLWADRLKMGTQTAQYYFARVKWASSSEHQAQAAGAYPRGASYAVRLVSIKTREGIRPFS
jgi:hypothetical protein